MKNILMGSTALFCLTFGANAANAACTPTSPVTAGQTVTCSGTSTSQVFAGAGQDNITVNIEDGAQLNTGALVSVVLNGSSSVNLLGSGQIHTTGNGAYGIYVAGDSTTVTLNDVSSIVTGGVNGIGILLGGVNDHIVLNGASKIKTLGANAYGIMTYGNSDAITLNDAASIVTSGANAFGINIFHDNNAVTLSGSSSVVTSGATADGISVAGNGNIIKLLDPATSVTVTGAGSHAIFLAGNNNQLENHGTLSSTTGTTILGDNGAGNHDIVTNFGIVSSNGGVKPIDLQAGDDTLTLGQGSQINGGDIDGGAGTDTLNLTGTGSEDNKFVNFEFLNVFGDDTKWTLSGNPIFINNAIHIASGTLIDDGFLNTVTVTIDPHGTLSGIGNVAGDVNSSGTIAPGHDDKIGTLTIAGNVVQSGGVIDISLGQGGTDKIDVLGIAATATLSNGVELRVSSLSGFTGGFGTILHADAGIIGSFGQVKYAGNGAVDVIPDPVNNNINIISVDGTPVAASEFAAAQSGLDYFDILGDEQLAGLRLCGEDSCALPHDRRRHLWAKGFGRFDQESASGGNQSFDATIAGSALGGDMPVAKDLRMGLSFGYGNVDEDVANHAASADINTVQSALYADYQKGGFFLTGAIGGGWQSFDLSRHVGASPDILVFEGFTSSGGSTEADADADTHGWLFNASLQTGVILPFPHGWRLTPSAGIAYQHQWVNGYQEHGAGSGDVAISDHQADALRLKAQLELANDIPWRDMVVTPHLKIGVRQEVDLGGHVNGTFTDNNDFTLDLKDSNRTVGLIGLGAEIAFANGLATYVDYDGAMTTDSTVHAVSGGLRYDW